MSILLSVRVSALFSVLLIGGSCSNSVDDKEQPSAFKGASSSTPAAATSVDDKEQPSAFKDASSSTPAAATVVTACANLNKLVGEPEDRCQEEIKPFLLQCPGAADTILECMTVAVAPTEVSSCTKVCADEGADAIAPAVPAERDTPQLAAACEGVAKVSGGGTPAGREVCRRRLAQQVGGCLGVETEVLECYATATNQDGTTACLRICVEWQIQETKPQTTR